MLQYFKGPSQQQLNSLTSKRITFGKAKKEFYEEKLENFSFNELRLLMKMRN